MNCDFTTIPSENIPNIDQWNLTGAVMTLTIGSSERAENFEWTAENIDIELAGGNCEVTDITLPTITCQME